MNKEKYMSKEEYLSWLKIGILAGEADKAAETTKDKVWHRKLKCVATYCQNIIEERIAYLDQKQLASLKRRRKQTDLKLCTSVPVRARDGEPNITVETEDLYDLLDLALKACMCCEQGKYVKNCKWRKVFHRIEVEPIRTAPKEGECEFRLDNELYFLTPQEYRIEMAKTAKENGADEKDVHITTAL